MKRSLKCRLIHRTKAPDLLWVVWQFSGSGCTNSGGDMKYSAEMQKILISARISAGLLWVLSQELWLSSCRATIDWRRRSVLSGLSYSRSWSLPDLCTTTQAQWLKSLYIDWLKVTTDQNPCQSLVVVSVYNRASSVAMWLSSWRVWHFWLRTEISLHLKDIVINVILSLFLRKKLLTAVSYYNSIYFKMIYLFFFEILLYLFFNECIEYGQFGNSAFMVSKRLSIISFDRLYPLSAAGEFEICWQSSHGLPC